MKKGLLNFILNDKEKLVTLCNLNNISYQATNRLILKYIEHKSYKEIASIEGVEVDSIKQSLYRARQKLNI